MLHAYLSATEDFICHVLTGFYNSITIQLKGNDWTFSDKIW